RQKNSYPQPAPPLLPQSLPNQPIHTLPPKTTLTKRYPQTLHPQEAPTTHALFHLKLATTTCPQTPTSTFSPPYQPSGYLCDIKE
ncbi:hypothetical protein, partial [Bordetella tumbae]|uniref:hypothetical protein n=1 Tax=Bordetella tumbae TaxID=1649139 RepID=UPI0039EE4C02